MIKTIQIVFAVFFLLESYSQENHDFKKLNNSKKWHLKLSDSCTTNWENNWFLDGKLAKIEMSNKGMIFSAGPIEKNDANHAVLWTKKRFKGDIKIEYNYTRTDSKTSWVNILYIQAMGVKPYKQNIFKWRKERTIPSMKTYFNNMKTLHISYAAFNKEHNEYIRVRQYPKLTGKDFNTTTEITPAIFDSGLFNTNEIYRITVIKTRSKLYFKVKGEKVTKTFSWSLSNTKAIKKGNVGLRHMYTRSARYSNFKIYTK